MTQCRDHTLAFVIEKPMQVYSPIIEALRFKLDVTAAVYYYGSASQHRRSIDPETGIRTIWDLNAVKTREPGEYVENSVIGALRFAWRLHRGRKPAAIILQGTRGRFCRTLIAAGSVLGLVILVRYDAVLNSDDGLVAKILRKVTLPVVFLQVKKLGYTGAETKLYLLEHGARESQLVEFPYVIDNLWWSAEIKKWREIRDEERLKVHAQPSTMVFLVVAKLISREGASDAVRAFIGSAASLDDAKLIVVGDGEQRDAIKALVPSVFADKVFFLGYVEYKRLPLYFAVADCYVHAAHCEVWGVSVQEAMVAGLPIIASDRVGSATELIRHGENGYRFKAGEIEELSVLFAAACSNPDRMKAFGRKNMILVDELSPINVARRLKAVLLKTAS